MPSDPDSLAGDLIRAVEILGEVFEARGVRYALLGGLAKRIAGRGGAVRVARGRDPGQSVLTPVVSGGKNCRYWSYLQ